MLGLGLLCMGIVAVRVAIEIFWIKDEDEDVIYFE